MIMYYVMWHNCVTVKYLPTKQQQNTTEYNDMNIIRTSIRSNTKSLFASSVSRADLLTNTSSSTPDMFNGVMNVVLFHIADMVAILCPVVGVNFFTFLFFFLDLFFSSLSLVRSVLILYSFLYQCFRMLYLFSVDLYNFLFLSLVFFYRLSREWRTIICDICISMNWLKQELPNTRRIRKISTAIYSYLCARDEFYLIFICNKCPNCVCIRYAIFMKTTVTITIMTSVPHWWFVVSVSQYHPKLICTLFNVKLEVR